MKSRVKSSSVVAVALVVLALAVPAAASAAWGAIALNVPTGQAGVAYNEGSKSAAKKAAIKDCPGKCRAALIVLNKCGAIAVNNNGRYVAGFGNSKKEAVKKAKKKARKAGGGAKLIAFVCSG
ncbi:MAG: DUF4189 domain-containing protein [Solirubrobacterales bacterium]